MIKSNVICKQRGEGGEKTREDGEREKIDPKLNFRME